MILSVIIPVYNVEPYLNKCVSTVLQMKTELEVVLVDDGSTDGSGKLCDWWAEQNVRIKVIHQANGGLSAARNTGIRNSSGEFVMFLDSDDYLDSKEADRMIEQRNDDVHVLMGLYREVYSDNDAGQNENSYAFYTMRGLTDVSAFLSALPIDGKGCFMTAWRFVCRRSFLLENALFFMPDIYHEDEEWSQRMFSCAKSIFVTHCHFYQYRQARAGSIMASVKPKRIYDRFIIIQCGTEVIQSSETKQAVREYILKQMALIYYANLVDCHILDEKAKREVWPQYKQYQYLLDYQNNAKGKIFSFVRKLVGIKAICNVFSLMHRMKKKLL